MGAMPVPPATKSRSASGRIVCRSVRGASKRDAIRHFVAQKHSTGVDAQTDRIYTEFCDYLAQLFNSGGVKAIAGAAGTFAWLRERNIKVALNTGFDRPTEIGRAHV